MLGLAGVHAGGVLRSESAAADWAVPLTANPSERRIMPMPMPMPMPMLKSSGRISGRFPATRLRRGLRWRVANQRSAGRTEFCMADY